MRQNPGAIDGIYAYQLPGAFAAATTSGDICFILTTCVI